MQFTNIVDFMIIMPLGPQLMRIFHITPEQFSILVSSYTITAGISGFLSAFIADRFDRKSLLIFAYTGFIIGTLACGFSKGYYMLMCARIFTGIFGGFISATVLSIVGDLIPIERRASAMGIIILAFSMASILGVPFGLMLADHFSWHAPFFWLAIFSLIFLILAIKIVPNVNAHLKITKDEYNKSPLNVITEITKDKNQMMALLLMATLVLGQFTVIPFISPYLVSNAGLPEKDLKYIYLVGGLVSMITAPIIGKWADKKGRAKIYMIACIAFLFSLLAVTNITSSPIWLILVVVGLFFMFSTARSVPAQAIISSTVLPQRRGGFMSIVSCFQNLSSGLSSYLAGKIVIKSTQGTLLHFNIVGYIAVVFSIVSIILAMRIRELKQ